MSRPDLDIIHSREAETFLRMVTEGFYGNSRLGLWMYEVIGREWDEMAGWAEGLKEEIHPQTCTWSIDIWEWVYGVDSDETLSLEYRRQRILAKIIGAHPINPEVIRRGVAALLGMPAEYIEVHNLVKPYCFAVKIYLTAEPLPAMELFRYIDEIKPAHLAFGMSVETQLGISGNEYAAVAAVSYPSVVITNQKQYEDVHIKTDEKLAAAVVSCPDVIITNGSSMERKIEALGRAGAKTVINQKLIIGTRIRGRNTGAAVDGTAG